MDAEVIQTTIDRASHTVLVVDDQAATRYSTGRLLRAAGFLTAEAASGAEALAMATQGISAVVLDVHLPDMDGFEVCRRLRGQSATRSLPVVHLSAAYVRNEDRITGLNAGADAYLVHPVEPPVLVATIQALIRARTAEDQLRRSEQRFRAVYDQAPGGIALIDPRGCFADANPALVALLGRPLHTLLGQPLAALAPPHWQALAARHLGPASGEPAPWRGELPLLHAEGHEVPLEWTVSPEVDGLRIGIASDSSERHELERRRHEVLEREQAARSAAERHSRTKDDFIAVLSHELRTPLNAIMGWVHILLRRQPTPEARKGLESIERNVKTQARIISDILDVSRINAGKLTLYPESTDPAELVLSSIGSLRSAIDEKRLRIETDVAGAHAPAWLDAARFQQIFWNLMTNAVKFSQPDSEIRVLLRREGDRLDLTVQDFGQGIRSDFVGQLFDRFSQSDAPGNRRHGGLGLGLSIVKHLVDLHGGSVEAFSAGPGQGTTMRVSLPVALPAEAALPVGDSQRGRIEEEQEDNGALAGLRVLVVEDDPDALEMLTVVLSDRRMQVRTAADFEQALHALDAEWPDALVCDIGLPGRDGYELIREVRARQPAGRPRLPAVALTAFARGEDRMKALDAGFDLHLPKPLKPHLLLSALGVIAPRLSAGAAPARPARGGGG